MSASKDNPPTGPPPEFSEELHQRLVKLLKLLADDKRLRIVLHLGCEGELHVSHLCDRLGQSQPAVSHHLALMRDAGLIEKRRDGKHNYYSICPELFDDAVNDLFSLFGGGRRSVQLSGVTLERTT